MGTFLPDDYLLDATDDIQTVTIQKRGGYTDAVDGEEKVGWFDVTPTIRMDIQPPSGARPIILPPAVAASADFQGFGPPDHADLKTGNRVKLADGTVLTITWAANYPSSHTTLALKRGELT